jgi:hypothetical protein
MTAALLSSELARAFVLVFKGTTCSSVHLPTAFVHLLLRQRTKGFLADSNSFFKQALPVR